MDLSPYLASVAGDLERATALADDHVRDIAGRLVAALEPGLRLALVRAVSDTAAQINTELDDAVVTVTMSGNEPVVTVTRTGDGSDSRPVPPAPPAPPTPPDVEGDGGDTARISLRLPEQLKARAEERAESAGQSLNAWLVHTIRAATSGGTTTHDRPGPTTGSRRVTGWA